MPDDLRDIHHTDQATTRASRLGKEVAAFYLTLINERIPEPLANHLAKDYAEMAVGTAMMHESVPAEWEIDD